jgi:hypothetical protein
MKDLARLALSCSREKRRPTIEAIRSTPIYRKSEMDSGSKMLTTNGWFRAKEGVDKPCQVTAANLANRPVRKLLPCRWILKGGEARRGRGDGGFGFRDESVVPKYGGKILRRCSKSSRYLFAVPRELAPSPSVAPVDVVFSIFARRGWLAGNGSIWSFPLAWSGGALRTVCDTTRSVPG